MADTYFHLIWLSAENMAHFIAVCHYWTKYWVDRSRRHKITESVWSSFYGSSRTQTLHITHMIYAHIIAFPELCYITSLISCMPSLCHSIYQKIQYYLKPFCIFICRQVDWWVHAWSGWWCIFGETSDVTWAIVDDISALSPTNFSSSKQLNSFWKH